MSRINTNVAAMVAARVYASQNETLTTSLTRLSTGLRINSGKDDPAGLIASETLRSEKRAIQAAQYNIVRANNVVSVAESGLNEINRLMTDLEELLDKSANEAGISADERDANQVQIDAILASINRIANSTEFQGRKLLSGELDYTTSGISTASFADVSVLGARVANGTSRSVVVQVTASAQLAQLTYAASATGAGTTTIEVAGFRGTEVFSFGSATSVAQLSQAINESSSLTGVSSYVDNDQLILTSTEYGSSKFVSVKALTGSFTVTGGDAGDTKDFGRDASVLINGTAAVVDGLRARVQTTALSLELNLTTDFGTTPGSSTFHIKGGGANFMITPEVSLNGLESLGVQSVATSNLGRSGVGFLSSLGSGQANSLVSKNFSDAQRIIREAQKEVATLRGRLGAFQANVLDTMSNALNITLENTAAAESAIRDTDFALETSSLTRAQILVQSATNTLRLANQQPQSVLALLQ